MSKVIKKSSRFITLSLCIALLFTNTLILAPEVGAASDTIKTETEMNINSNIPAAEDAVLTQRAIAIDSAKKEAQAAVDEQLAIIAQEEEDAKKEEQTETLQSDATGAANDASSNSSSAGDNSASDSAESSSSSVDANYEDSYAEPAYGFLMSIDNPDPGYCGYSISLSDSERDIAERMIMGEAGSCGFTGMALVAQCIRDTYIQGGYSSIHDVLAENGYYGSTSITPSDTAREVVSYIFDQGGSAVQHSIRVFYASDICSSSWHESQEYVCSYGYVRFFDM